MTHPYVVMMDGECIFCETEREARAVVVSWLSDLRAASRDGWDIDAVESLHWGVRLGAVVETSRSAASCEECGAEGTAFHLETCELEGSASAVDEHVEYDVVPGDLVVLPRYLVEGLLRALVSSDPDAGGEAGAIVHSELGRALHAALGVTS